MKFLIIPNLSEEVDLQSRQKRLKANASALNNIATSSGKTSRYIKGVRRYADRKRKLSVKLDRGSK